MVSLFYSSNEKKQRKYIKDRRIQEENQENQQQIVDDAIDKELGLDIAATKTGLLYKRVANKLTSFTPMTSADDNTLINAINNGKLSELFDKIKLLSDSSLTKTQQNIRDNLKNPNTKQIINKLIQEAIPNGPEAIKNVILEAFGDSNQESILKLITKADKINLKEFNNIVNPENNLMNKEDTLSRLTTMNANQDYAIRKKFDNVLNEMASEAKSIADKKLWKQMKAAIEKQRMADAYKEWTDNASKSAFAEKIQRNLKALLWNKKLQNIGKEKRGYSFETTTSELTETPSIDLRTYNVGRPPDTKEKALKKMHEYKKKADNLSVKLWAKNESGRKYKVQGGDRNRLKQEVENAYNSANKIATKYGLK